VARRVTDPTGFSIGVATVADAARVAALGARLFTQAYGPTHPEPELGRYLARSFDVERMAAELTDGGTEFFIVQDDTGADIGYAYLRESREAPPAGVVGQRAFEIARFYVDEAWHGRGVAPAMMAACVTAARARKADVLWLATWEPAVRAQAFYRRMGFEMVGTTTFLFGDVLEDDVLMARRLDR
jgi:ribosomal protein S18 acetylase RimI-like enzyme